MYSKYYMKNNLLDIIIKYCNPMIDSPELNASEIEVINDNINEIVKAIFQNNVDLYFLEKVLGANSKSEKLVKQDSKLNEIYNKGLAARNIYTKTLAYVVDILNRNSFEYLIFKTVAPLEHLKDDIDIFIQDRDEYLKLKDLLVMGGFFKSKENNGEYHMEKPNYVQLDIHNKISWDYLGNGGQGPNIIDLTLLMNRRVKTKLYGVEIYKTSIEDDLIVVLAHAIFQHKYLTLGEILFAGEIIRKSELDWEYIKNQLDRFHWLRSFVDAIQIISCFYFIYWRINLILDKGFETRKVNTSSLEKKLSYCLPIIDLNTIKVTSENSYLKGMLHILIYTYRLIYYTKIKSEYAFNTIPMEFKD